MKKLPAWILPLGAFGVAAVLSVMAEGHLSILARVPQATTPPNCSGNLLGFCTAGAQWSMTVSSIRTLTTAPDAGSSSITASLENYSSFTIHYTDGTFEKKSEYITYAGPTSGTTKPGVNVTTNYPNVKASKAQLTANVEKKGRGFGAKGKTVKSVDTVSFTSEVDTTLEGTWTTPMCGKTALGPTAVLKVFMNPAGTGNGCLP